MSYLLFLLQSELFQKDIFPDCVSDEPALTPDEWLAGKDADPKQMSMEDKFHGKAKGGGSGTKTAARVGIARKAKAAAKDEDVSGCTVAGTFQERPDINS